uniref:AlNc14C62G4508 protein n=1 Tax=Albugo laibachii Nc14 TaxID=890382 RepID=F0WCY3_9STRA|nr:AlNc14C62G4508 [Albugo laibachii Nc14]|eukprot:CCA19054.1 AlNc14C62G4508 [Albugo laibachii Nc14]
MCHLFSPKSYKVHVYVIRVQPPLGFGGNLEKVVVFYRSLGIHNCAFHVQELKSVKLQTD